MDEECIWKSGRDFTTFIKVARIALFLLHRVNKFHSSIALYMERCKEDIN